MTYTVETSTVRTSTSDQEQQLITIEFAPKIHPNETEYNYQQPLFVFGEQVINPSHLSSSTPLTVCGMELVESKTNSGRLINQPYWKYLVKDGQNTFRVEESALKRYSNTCSQCPHFNDHQDDRGRGWCNLFDQAARTYHQRTNDCDTFADYDPLDTLHPLFAIESRVKVIDPQEHHTEWATFVVIGRKYNHNLHRSTETYLSEPSWYYQLARVDYNPTFKSSWLAQNDLCLFDESHLIETEEIF
jgi:hypothetical protein